MLCDVVGRMMGDAKVMETGDPATKLFGQFNDSRFNRFWIVVNEAESKDCHTNSEKLKDMVTARDFMMEAKGQPAVKRSCFARLYIYIPTTRTRSRWGWTPGGT